MTLFWLLIFLMTILALGIVITPLIYIAKKHRVTNSKIQVTLYREQLQILDEQLKKSDITVEEYERSRDELEQALLTNVTEQNNSTSQSNSSYLTAIILIFLLPIIAISLYLYWGNSKALTQSITSQQQAAQIKAAITKLGSTENIIKALQNKLKQNPDSAKGWYLLGKLYLSQQQFTNAVAAFAKANTLQANDPEIMENYAESLFFIHQEKLTPQIKTLLNKVLTLQPQNINALNLFALGFYRAGDYQSAIDYWRKILNILPPDSNDNKTVAAMITQAEKQALPENANIKLTIAVTLAKNLASQVKNTDSLFVYAQAINGPPMPLAVVRKTVADLPLKVTLTPANAMMPTMTLANFSQVKIFARISKSGQVMPQPGDLQGKVDSVNVRDKHLIQVIIDQHL